jgi:hypothetical protein
MDPGESTMFWSCFHVRLTPLFINVHTTNILQYNTVCREWMVQCIYRDFRTKTNRVDKQMILLSSLSLPDKSAVDDWITSRKIIHVMRDLLWHSQYAANSGMWGGTRGAMPNMHSLLLMQRQRFCQLVYYIRWNRRIMIYVYFPVRVPFRHQFNINECPIIVAFCTAIKRVWYDPFACIAFTKH